MSEDTTSITAAVLTRVTKDCDPQAQVRVVIGKIPVTLPIETISIKQNGNNEEVIALNLDVQKIYAILDDAVKLLEEVKCE